MAGWRRLVVAALLQLACSRALPTESNCYEEGMLSQGSGYFYCSEPRLNFNDTSKNLIMDFRNKNKNNVFGLSLNRTADAFHIITMKDSETINSTKFDLRNSSSELPSKHRPLKCARKDSRNMAEAGHSGDKPDLLLVHSKFQSSFLHHLQRRRHLAKRARHFSEH
ncbi:uncharacterized protein LOC134775927 isoform X2 [Penaeus indicus]|uniref:uncharacterized protein LOC134775927 isoform X2 n=1 Tax=Penaeus indicus TaxID=29960 RepID=UPI00300D5805